MRLEQPAYATVLERIERGQASFRQAAERGSTYTVRVDPRSVDDVQAPCAAVLSCSDARVPTELVLGQAANDLFVVRVAGGVAGAECIGSLGYAVAHLPSVEAVVVLGHSRCGAVGAAVQSLLDPAAALAVAADLPLRSLVHALLPGVHGAAAALHEVHGVDIDEHIEYRESLTETAVVATSAMTASVLSATVDLPVLTGVFDLARGSVGYWTTGGWVDGLRGAPADEVELGNLVQEAARHQVLA